MAQHKFNFRLITRDDSTAVACDAWLEGWNLEGRRMSEARDFRRWAAQVARRAGEEPDANEAQRLLSIAEYWVRLAEMEDWQRDRPGNPAAARVVPGMLTPCHDAASAPGR